MALAGTFSTMPLPDLLQWLAAAEKSGTLRVDRGRCVRSIRLQDGSVTGCSSDEPSLRLGQFLLCRRRITEKQLTQALTAQESQRGFLGQVLVELGALTSDELRQELEANAEEIIYSLFDWDDGVFRFEEQEDAAEQDVYPVDLRIESILLCGLQRVDDMTMIRQLLYDPRLVLRYTSKPPGPEIFGDETSRSIYSAIDGERTLADILLHMHGTEYMVKKFLFDLHLNGYVEIAGLKETGTPPPVAEPELPPLEVDLPGPTAPEAVPAPAAPAPTPAMTVTEPARAAAAATPAETGEPEHATVAGASQRMARGEYEAALDILDRLYRRNPGDDALRRLTAEAEAAFVEQVYREHLPAEKVPILNSSLDSMASESLSPQEFFLLSRIDGSWNIKSIIQVAPFGEVLALRTLKRLQDLGVIELLDPV